MSKLKLEIAVFDALSARLAAEAGASRIELCTGAPEGGLTPSAGLLQTVKQIIDIPVFVMLRPRAGDFCYHHIEKEVVRNDLMLMRKMGADGFVCGALLKDHHVDIDFIKEVVSLAHPLPVTFDRAIDRCANPEKGIEMLISAGVKTILSSGTAPDALSGAPRLARWISDKGKHICIMPGAGVNDKNADEIAALTGASWLHLSAKKMTSQVEQPGVKMGSADSGYYQSVDPDIIKNIISLGL